MPATTSPDLETRILRALLADRTAFVSGELLAEKLGITRVAVWQHLQKLRAEGFSIEAVRNVGYRITRLPPAPHAALLRLLIAPRKNAPAITVLDTIDSTNDEATRRLAAGAPTPLAIISREQTKGRGRFRRPWHSKANGNLYITLALRPRATPSHMQTFTLWMGVNLCDLVASRVKNTPGIKWPNDLLFGARKAAGMLTEARIDADQIRDLVFGLGLNINSAPAGWPPELRATATSLLEQNDNTPLDFNPFVAALITRLADACDEFIDAPETTAAALAALWKKYDLLAGKPITILSGNDRLSGAACGIDPEGSLILTPAAGSLPLKVRAGEVTIGKIPNANDQIPKENPKRQ
jgi:BirA family biotin operon repressor/biotin-[acetyl-CoA-carboxylase] ligase